MNKEQLKALLEKNDLQPTTNNQQLNSLESSSTPESTEVKPREDEVQPQTSDASPSPTPQPSLEVSAGEMSATVSEVEPTLPTSEVPTVESEQAVPDASNGAGGTPTPTPKSDVGAEPTSEVTPTE